MTPRIWVLGLAALPLVACKLKEGSQAPHRDVHGWTLAEIEAELVRNDAALAGEGIMVAMATPTVTPPNVTGSGFEEAVDPSEGEGIEPTPPIDDGDEAGDEPTVDPEPGPPEPMPTPTASPGTQPDYEGAELTSAAPDSPAERRREGKRRLSARSRRDTDTRCDRLCGLAEATCELETQICELATRHPDEPRYQQACLRAEQQCIAASDACQRCEE